MIGIRRFLPRHSIRLRLTLLYGGLFLTAGAGLLTVNYLLVLHTGRVLVERGNNGPEVITSLPQEMADLAARQRDADLHHLLVNSGIALTIMAVAALGLGWFIAGHVLRPLRVITTTTQQISAHNLHHRLALDGPADELKHLADTIDGLLERLQAAFGAQRHFVANASHELRTPLTYDRTLLEVTLADPRATASTLRTACEEILNSNLEQERLIDALLTLASSERGLDSHVPFDLAAIAATIVASRRTDDRLRFEVRLRPAPATGDPRLIERLVTNLIDNATVHNITGGWVELSTGTRDGRAFLAVANSGPVITPDQVGRLLEPFQRLGAARTSHPTGHGLGLSIVAAVAATHHASLTVRPIPRGGLDITVELPPIDADNPQLPAAHAQSTAASPAPLNHAG